MAFLKVVLQSRDSACTLHVMSRLGTEGIRQAPDH